MATEHAEDLLAEAIRSCRRVRLAYRRKADEVISVHEVAPIDVRGGWTSKTANTIYLWAWCFAEDQAEMHVMDRVVSVHLLEDEFEPTVLLQRWPKRRWPIPSEWTVDREWG